MVMSLLAGMKKDDRTAKGNISGLTEQIMLETLLMDSNKVRGNGQKVIWEPSQHLKESMSKIKRKAMVNFTGQQGIITKETLKMMSDMVKEKCSGQTEVCMKEAGYEVYSMEWVKCSFRTEQ